MALILSGDTGVPASGMPTGSVIQTQSTTLTSMFTTTSSSFTDITGLSVSITPTSSTSKILVICSFQFGTNSGSGYAQFAMYRNSTLINAGDAAGSRKQGVLSENLFSADGGTGAMLSTNYLDSPATTSATTYKMQALQSGGTTVYVGSVNGDLGTSNGLRSASTITVMEIKQ